MAHSPNPAYAGGLQVLSFIVYAIFAYGGLEVVGGLVDQTENPEKNFPKGIIISAVVVSLGYSLGILIFGTFTKWSFAFTQFSAQKITLGNVSYIAMNHMGYQLGLAHSFRNDEHIHIVRFEVGQFSRPQAFVDIKIAVFIE